MNLSERMLACRAKLNLTQEEFAIKIGVSRFLIARAEAKNTDIRPVNLKKIEIFIDENTCD